LHDGSLSETSMLPTRLERWVAPPTPPRMRAGIVVMAAAALGLFVAMFLPWYRTSAVPAREYHETGWELIDTEDQSPYGAPQCQFLTCPADQFNGDDSGNVVMSSGWALVTTVDVVLLMGVAVGLAYAMKRPRPLLRLGVVGRVVAIVGLALAAGFRGPRAWSEVDY
jgi:hypothetical protein